MQATTAQAGGARSRRADPWLTATILAGAAALVGLLYLDRSLTFWWDEWSFIRIPGMGTPQDWLTPHNEHWSTLPLLLYRATFSVIGLHSYLPYVAELIAIHLLAVAGAVALVRRDLGPAAGFVAALPLLFLGSGYQNLVWAFQTGFVGSTAAGIWALYALDTADSRGAVAGAVLLLASLLCSGIGLFWLAAAGVELALDPSRRHRLNAILPAVAAYAVWYPLFGASTIAERRSPFSLQAVLDIPVFVAKGIAHFAGSWSGLGRVVGSLGMLVLVLFTAIRFVRRAAPPRAVAMLAGLFAMFATIALVRAGLSDSYGARTRYAYVAAFFLVPALSSWIRQLSRAGPPPVLARLTILGLVGVCVAANIAALRPGLQVYQDDADLTRAFIAAAKANEGRPWVDWSADYHMVPTAAEALVLVDRFGDPNRDTLIPSVVPAPGPEAHERALIMLMGRNFRVEPGREPVPPAPMTIAGLGDAQAEADGGCLRAAATRTGGYVTVWVPGGGSVSLTPASTGSAGARIGRAFQPAPRTRIPVPLATGATTVIRVPNTGDGPWQVLVELPASSVRMCVSPGT